jgi:hypothetical protein
MNQKVGNSNLSAHHLFLQFRHKFVQPLSVRKDHPDGDRRTNHFQPQLQANIGW